MVDGNLEQLILECLAKDPDIRPTADQVLDRMVQTAPRVGTRTPTVAGAAATSAAGSAVPTPRSRSRRVLLATALVAVLALLGGLGVFALLGDGEQGEAPATVPESSTQPVQGTAPAGENRDTSRTAPSPAAPGLQEATVQQTVPQAAPPPEEPPLPEASPPAGGSDSSGGDEEAAARTIENVYQLAAAGDYDRSYSLLSQGFKQRSAQTPAEWQNTFDTLERISFLEGPSVRVQNGTAWASGVTRAEHTDRTERNAATWTLVREGGEWKLEALTIEDRQLLAS